MSLDAGSGSNAIMAAYHLIHALQKLEAEWNERAKADKHFKALNAPDQFQSRHHQGRRLGLQRTGLVRRRLPDCGAAGLVGRRLPEGDSGLRLRRRARSPLSSPTIRPRSSGRGFLSEGYELTGSAAPEAAFGKAFTAVYGGAVQDLAFTALTDTRFYGLNYNIPSLCFGASGDGDPRLQRICRSGRRCGSRRRRPRCSSRSGAGWRRRRLRPQRFHDRIQPVGQRRRSRLQDQRRLDLDDAVVDAPPESSLQPGRCLMRSGTTFLPHQEARITSGAASRTTSGKMIRSFAAC